MGATGVSVGATTGAVVGATVGAGVTIESLLAGVDGSVCFAPAVPEVWSPSDLGL